jgi:transposase
MLRPTGWWLAREPVDLRCGVDGLWRLTQASLGRDPVDGGAYIYRNRSGTRIKVLCVDAHGVWLAVRRLHDGRFANSTDRRNTLSISLCRCFIA